MAYEIGQYNGHPTISLMSEVQENKFPTRVSFGYAKAKLVMDNYIAIKSFVEEIDKQRNGGQ